MNINVGKTLDEGRWTPFQLFLVICTALAIILDGVDIQLLGNAVPRLQEEWWTPPISQPATGPSTLPATRPAAPKLLPRSAFSTALAIGLVGMMIGGALGGWLSDRIGRRNTLLLSVLAFAFFTLAFYYANSIRDLVVLRFLSGIGLGGAVPIAAALSSEYVSRRLRPFAVTVTIVCVPLGGMLAGQLAAYIIPHYGWRTLFLVGGTIPILLAIILFFTLPESPRYLARRPRRWPELINLLRNLGHDVPADAQFTESGDAGKAHSSIKDLFQREFVRDTLALFGSFFFCLMANYLGFLLLPTALKTIGYPQEAGSAMLSWWNLGGVGGALLAAFMIHRLGSRITMLGMSAIAIACAFIMAAMQLDPSHRSNLLLMCILLGGALNAVQTAMYALATHVYPTQFRGLGVGSAVAFGRVGAYLAPYLGNYALDQGRLPAYFTTFGILMVLAFITLAIVSRHISRAGGAGENA